MAAFIDLTNQRFGRLTVLECKTKLSNSDSIWLCECDCGKKKRVKGGALKHVVRSCGCLKREPKKTSKSIRLEQKQTRVHRSTTDINTLELRARWSRKKAHSKKRNIKWDLSYEEWLRISSEDCIFCGQPPQSRSSRQTYNGPPIYCGSIDRIDWTKGYTIGNVQPACDLCNVMKSTLSNSEFIEQCKKIVRRH
jgi:hypothetical protein